MNTKKGSTNDQSQPSFTETARRAQIIDCALDVIAELGLAQASLAQIAKRADVSTGVILYYFRSKEELIDQVLQHATAVVFAFVSERIRHATPTTALLSYIDAHVACHATCRKHLLVIMNIHRANSTARGAPVVDKETAESRRERLREILSWGQKAGEFRSFDIATMTAAILSILDAIPGQLPLNPDLDFELYSKELAQIFARAILADPPSTNSTATIWHVFQPGGGAGTS